MQRGGVLAKLGKTSILATDIASQFWCERQMELNYLHGKKYTKAMAKGKQLHEALQAETYVPLTIEPVTYRDLLYKIAYENYMSLLTLKKVGKCREVRIYGSVNGYRISGQIDELLTKEGKTAIVEVKTTEASKAVPVSIPHTVQVTLYRKLLDDLRSGAYGFGNFSRSNDIAEAKLSDVFVRELNAMGVKEELIDINKMYLLMFSEFQSLPELSDRLEIRYIDRFSGKEVKSIEISYRKEEIDSNLEYVMKYWNGERESMPVPEEEKWKCKLCKFFGNECKVWWGK